jgi:hypothetical protein
MMSEEERGGAHPDLLSGLTDLDAVSPLRSPLLRASSLLRYNSSTPPFSSICTPERDARIGLLNPPNFRLF